MLYCTSLDYTILYYVMLHYTLLYYAILSNISSRSTKTNLYHAIPYYTPSCRAAAWISSSWCGTITARASGTLLYRALQEPLNSGQYRHRRNMAVVSYGSNLPRLDVGHDVSLYVSCLYIRCSANSVWIYHEMSGGGCRLARRHVYPMLTSIQKVILCLRRRASAAGA